MLGTTATVGPHTWEITRPVVTGGRLHHATIGTYTQLPFRLAWAITIHKSQGQTIDRLVVDLTGGVFATGQVYVALSRATSLDGLVLKRPIGAEPIEAVQLEHFRLAHAAALRRVHGIASLPARASSTSSTSASARHSSVAVMICAR